MMIVNAQLKRPTIALEVNLTFNQSVTAIFGASGSGKSTLLNIIAGITKPDTGFVNINGEVLLDTAKHINTPIHQRNIGLVFQDARLFPHLSVKQNLCYAMPDKSQNQQLMEVANMLEIKPLLQQKPNALSGGEKQRVALGRAILSQPRLLMLDEPLASLDTRLKDQILPYLTLITQQVNIPMIYVSHDKNEIAQITDHVIHIDNGQANYSQ